ncbi:MAG: SAM hydrolase/SAM-dependent halogenase family protein [Desulfobaccales bacterium]
MTHRPVITLLTDFGTRDPYVAAMKGIILSLNPAATLVDLTHDIAPQDITAAAFFLEEAAPYFPVGTIHLAVVDPGVGTSRRGLAARAGDHFWVGPDNGLFHLIFQQKGPAEVVSLENPEYFRSSVSTTFHGRDIFAPVAAHLSLGTPLGALGPAVADPVALPWPAPDFTPEAVRGEIVYVDGFGNLISNIKGQELLAWLAETPPLVILGSLTIRNLVRTYGEVAPGGFLALVGSHGFLEIAANQGNAAQRLSVGKGRPVSVVKG